MRFAADVVRGIIYFRAHMRVHRDLDFLPEFQNPVLTIGTFDGVHTGHQKILQQLKEEAVRIKGETVLITFHPHPRAIVQPTKPVKLINTLEEKIELLSQQEIDHLIVVPFTSEFSSLTADEYVRDFLVAKFKPHTIIIGYDHRFGHDRAGDYKLLEKLAPVYNYLLKEIPEHIVDSIAVSSTRIREAITGGQMGAANDLLGYTFFFGGNIIEGNKLGRKLGYPTANLEVQKEKLIPGNGVYAVEAMYGGRKMKGMMNIGIRPTLTDGLFMIEVNLFDFDAEIYGEYLRVFVKKYMRPEMKFNGLDALKEQIGKDKVNVMSVLDS